MPASGAAGEEIKSETDRKDLLRRVSLSHVTVGNDRRL
jgi:hypothetical protein